MSDVRFREGFLEVGQPAGSRALPSENSKQRRPAQPGEQSRIGYD
jgi:hypothetical protein